MLDGISLGPGLAVITKLPSENTPVGSVGICFDQPFSGVEAFSFIFEDGSFDTFSVKEVVQYFIFVENLEMGYEHVNNERLARDFEYKIFEPFFKQVREIVKKVANEKGSPKIPGQGKEKVPE